jgi:hypothetical protein
VTAAAAGQGQDVEQRRSAMSFWWCLQHGRVEGSAYDDSGCANMSRLGPYDTEEQAAQALDRARARTAALEAEEEAEDDWGKR